jgi:hypothetical protein
VAKTKRKTKINSSLTFFSKAEKSKQKTAFFNFHKAFPAEHSVLSLRACLPEAGFCLRHSGQANVRLHEPQLQSKLR